MRLRVFSDLHTEFGPVHLPPQEADVVVLAGDIGKGVRAVAWALEAFPDTPVVAVAGNHELYRGALPRTLEKMREAAESTNVTVLDREEVILHGVRFLGTTLWTDFGLFGADRTFACAEAAASGMNDYRRIRTSPQYSRLRPADTRREHVESRQWLRDQLASPTEARMTVVVTHHAPSARSLSPVHATDPLSAAYASNLDELVEGSGAALWVHGHTHHCVDYMVGSTRVFSNQRGYPGELVAGFDELGLVELA